MTDELCCYDMGNPACTHKPEFKWPCDRRVAHGPHRTNKQVRTLPYAGSPTMRSAPYDCPGVKAHPDTMIGRSNG